MVEKRRHFNPRTPCGVRQHIQMSPSSRTIFQSTHPLRGATNNLTFDLLARPHFNPRTPCGVRLLFLTFYNVCVYFNPRTPCGVRPVGGTLCSESLMISIHAPLAGCDSVHRYFHQAEQYFNPRTPCGVRLCSRSGFRYVCHFNPRTPCGVRQQKYTKNLLHFCNNRQ